MSTASEYTPQPADDFSLGALFRATWNRRYIVAAVAILGGVIAAIVSLVTTPLYRAEVAVTEVRENGMGAMGSLASQLGGLASIAGVNLGNGADNGKDAQAVLTSRHLVEEFVCRNKLLPVLYPDAKKPPTLWFAVRRFQDKVLNIKQETRTGLTIVSIDWTDPETAARWANGIVALANEMIRARALAESTRNVTYLREQIEKTNVIDLQKVMYNLIETETKTLMLANARAEYAFKVIDPAVEPEIRHSPRRMLMTIFGFILGGCVGVAYAIWRRATPSRRAGT